MNFKKYIVRVIFQTWRDYDLAQGLAIHARFDYLDLVSRSQVCHNHELHIVFWILVSRAQNTN